MKRVVKNVVAVALIALVLLTVAGCMSHEHIVGRGSQTGVIETELQW